MSSHEVVLLEVELKDSADVLTWGRIAGGWAEGQCWRPHMRLFCWRLSWRTVLASSHEVVLLEVEPKDSADVLTWGCTVGGWAEEQCWCPHMRLYCWRLSWRTGLMFSHEVVLLEVELKNSILDAGKHKPHVLCIWKEKWIVNGVNFGRNLLMKKV
jgi:hypothetical protein